MKMELQHNSKLGASNPFFTKKKMKIQEVLSTNKEQRVAAHSHIKGLGLLADGTSEHAGAGFVGQGAAREVF
jgi:DNA helicase TIP49 (TBP-interacting protein)